MSKSVQQKRNEAEQRRKAHDIRSIQEQLDLIAARRGESKKERQALLDRLERLQKEYHGR